MLMKFGENYLYRIVFISGFLFAGLIFYNLSLSSSLPAYELHSGFTYIPLALEFSSNYENIMNLVGKMGDENLSKNLSTILQTLELDFLYIFLYSIFFLSIFEIASKMSSPPAYIRAFYYFLLICVILLDSAQNFILSEILNSNLSNPKIDFIFYLPKISFLLWNLIFLKLSISGILLWMGSPDLHIRIISLFFFLPFFFSFFSLFGRMNLIEVAVRISIPGLISFFLHSIWKMATTLFVSRNVAAKIKP
jgi:hypothetical protein